MDTIDSNVMDGASQLVSQAIAENPNAEWHTVTIVLNGQHGGADVTLVGYQQLRSVAVTKVLRR